MERSIRLFSSVILLQLAPKTNTNTDTLHSLSFSNAQFDQLKNKSISQLTMYQKLKKLPISNVICAKFSYS